MRFTIKGTDKLRQALTSRLPDVAARELAGALNVEAELIMTDSKTNYAPRNLGTLADSAFVEPPVRKGYTITSVLAYGGAASAYALAVHEHPSAHSPPSWAGKSATDIRWNVHGPDATKYLERPLNAAEKGLANRLARRMTIR
jgi:hypothetical protein